MVLLGRTLTSHQPRHSWDAGFHGLPTCKRAQGPRVPRLKSSLFSCYCLWQPTRVMGFRLAHIPVQRWILFSIIPKSLVTKVGWGLYLQAVLPVVCHHILGSGAHLRWHELGRHWSQNRLILPHLYHFQLLLAGCLLFLQSGTQLGTDLRERKELLY